MRNENKSLNMSLSKIGVGITTYRRPEYKKECLRSILSHSFCDNLQIYAAEDTDEDRRGVAFRKNECLSNLQDCDYIFLFDDDCWVKRDGWMEYFISESKRTGENHFLFLDKSHQKIKGVNGVDYYRECGGVFMFLTKKCLEECGGLNENYKLWGFEHAGYSQRIHKAGLTSHPYLHLPNSDYYLYSLDYDGMAQSSIKKEEKDLLINHNRIIFANEINNKQIYYPL